MAAVVVAKLKKLFNRLDWRLLIIIGAVVAASWLVAESADAGTIEKWVLTIFGWIVYAMVYVTGRLMLVVTSVLIDVAQIQNFITAPPVTDGWVIVRDLCNMFFILVLLIIAFATILRRPDYGIKQLLKSVLIMAILINFSKLICGVIIDFAQVIMLTFVNGFKDIAGGNFSQLLGIDKLLAIDPDAEETVSFLTILASFCLALLFSTIMLVVMVVLLVTLAMRVVMIWIYVILSPLAYLTAAIPATKGVANMWWNQFIQNVVTGPLLAFFIWLAISTLGSFKSDDNSWQQEYLGRKVREENAIKQDPSVSITQVGTTDYMMRFVVAIGLLIGGLIVSKQFGGAAGGAAASGLAKIQGGAGWIKSRAGRGAKKAAAWAGQKTWQGAKAVGGAAGRGGLALAKTVDYKASKGVAGIFGGEYQAKQGVLTRAAGGIKQNLFTKEGWKDNLRKAFRTDLNKDRMAATQAGYYDDKNGTRYKLQKEGKNAGHFVSDNGEFWTHNGNKVGKMEDTALAFNTFWRSGKGTAAKDAARVAETEAKLAAEKKLFDNRNAEELQTMLGGTTDFKLGRGIAMQLAEMGKFANQAQRDQAAKFFAKDPLALKTFFDKVNVKQAYLNYDLTNADQQAALGNLMKRGKVKISDQDLGAIDKDKPEDMRKLAEFMATAKEHLPSERWKAELARIDKEAVPATGEKYSKAAEINGHQAARSSAESWAESQRLTADAEREQAKGNRAEAVKKSAESRQAQEEAKRYGNESREWRKHMFSLDVNGDVAKAFTEKDGTQNYLQAREFFQTASAKELSQINAKSLDSSPAAKAAALDGMNYERLRQMHRSGDNMETTRLLAKIMAEGKHVEAEKIVNLYNDIDVDVKAGSDNKAIKELFNEKKVDATYKMMNDFREHLESKKDSGKYYKEKSAKEKKRHPTNDMKSAFEDFFPSLFGK